MQTHQAPSLDRNHMQAGRHACLMIATVLQAPSKAEHYLIPQPTPAVHLLLFPDENGPEHLVQSSTMLAMAISSRHSAIHNLEE